MGRFRQAAYANIAMACWIAATAPGSAAGDFSGPTYVVGDQLEDSPLELSGYTVSDLSEPEALVLPTSDASSFGRGVLVESEAAPGPTIVQGCPETAGSTGRSSMAVVSGPCNCDACTKRHRAPNQPGLVQNLLCAKQKCWIGRVDAMLLWRSSPSNRPMFTTFDPVTKQVGPVALNANQLVSDPLAAPRVSLFRPDGCGFAREVTYIYAGNFYSERTLPPVFQGYAVAAPGIYGNPWGSQPGAPPLTTVNAKLLATLQSLEFNARTPFLWDSAQFLFGFRWVQWQEQLVMHEQFSDPDFPTIRGTGLYDTDCINDLYGGQIGVDSLLLTTASGLRFEGLVKAGAYYNAAVQGSSYSYVTTAPFSFSKGIRIGGSPAGSAFVGEVGLTGVMPLRRNLDFRFGYFGLWLEGIAQPVNQLSGQTLAQPEIEPAKGSLTTNGGVVIHGLSLGLEGRW